MNSRRPAGRPMSVPEWTEAGFRNVSVPRSSSRAVKGGVT